MGSPNDDDPHPGPGVRTIYLDPFGDWEPKELGYLYDRGLVVGAAQRVLAIVVNYWDALDRKREKPIISAAREVYYRDGDGQTWDLAIRVPKRFDPASYELGSRPAMAGFLPGASLLWPICERGQLSAVMPQGQQPPPDRGGSQRVFWYSHWPLPKAVGRWPREVRGAHLVIIDRPGGPPARRLVWLITYGPPLRYMGLYETRDSHDRGLVRRFRICCWPRCAWPVTSRGSHTSYWGSPFDPLTKTNSTPRPGYVPGDRAEEVRGYRSKRGHLRQQCCATGGGGGLGYGPSPRDLPAKRRPAGSCWRAKGPHP